jgi:hypothetical protein
VAQIQEQPTTSQAPTKEKRKMPEHTTKGKEVININANQTQTLDEEDEEEDEFLAEDENDILERAVIIYEAKNNQTT